MGGGLGRALGGECSCRSAVEASRLGRAIKIHACAALLRAHGFRPRARGISLHTVPVWLVPVRAGRGFSLLLGCPARGGGVPVLWWWGVVIPSVGVGRARAAAPCSSLRSSQGRLPRAPSLLAARAWLPFCPARCCLPRLKATRLGVFCCLVEAASLRSFSHIAPTHLPPSARELFSDITRARVEERPGKGAKFPCAGARAPTRESAHWRAWVKGSCEINLVGVSFFGTFAPDY